MMAATIIGLSITPARAEDDTDLLALLPVWHQFYSVETGGGFEDNVTLSHSDPESVGFISTMGDAFFARDFADGSKLNLLFLGENRHFFGVDSIADEWAALAVVEGEKEFLEGSRGLLTVSYSYQDQVVDVSVTETELFSVRLTGHRLSLRPGFRPYLPGNTQVTLELPVRRQWLLEPLDSYWEFGPAVGVEKSLANDASIEVAGEVIVRLYDTYEALDSSGDEIPGTERILLRQDLHIDWRKPWDEARRWRTNVRTGTRFNQDNGGGFLDYVEFYGRAGLRYRNDDWEFSGETGVSHYRFSKQTVTGSSSSKRERTDLKLTFRCERRLWRELSVVGVYEYEQVYGNDPLDTYDASIVRGALKWEF
jgi:hypothetical protein